MNESLADPAHSFWGLALSTHRILVTGSNAAQGSEPATENGAAIFVLPHEALIAAIAIAFFRWTVRLQKNEPVLLRSFFCGLLATLAYSKKSYELITAVEIFSYAVVWFAPKQVGSTTSRQVLLRLLSITGGAVLSMLVAHLLLTSDVAWKLARLLTPSFIVRGLEYLFPVAELKAAYQMMEKLSLEPEFHRHMIQHLFFVTFHIQVGMGFLGIDFLRAEQGRRNELIRLDVPLAGDEDTGRNVQNGSGHGTESNKSAKLLEKSRIFQRGAAPFSKCLFCES
jgi:hypothetical protein